MDDNEIISSAARVIETPRRAPANSFVLHAPLELLARATLLPLVDEAHGAEARDQILRLRDQYEHSGDPVDEPADASFTTDASDTATRLLAAIAAGELDDVDQYAARLGGVTSADEMTRLLGAAVAPSLAAAAHASILFYLLPRVEAAGGANASLLRGPARELARYPDWRLRWFEQPDDVDNDGSLLDAVLATPMLGLPNSDFIFPIMSQAEEAGLPTKLLSGIFHRVDVASARRDLSRIAAWSMLQEPPDYAAYGWTHCLTMPQAVLGIAGHGFDESTAIAIAATHAIGFRSAEGQRSIDPAWMPDAPTTRDIEEAIDRSPAEASSVAWHTRPEDRPALMKTLASKASVHEDAHYVKYTLACIDAMRADPDAQHVYLASAASLAAWWATAARDR